MKLFAKIFGPLALVATIVPAARFMFKLMPLGAVKRTMLAAKV
jgi:hypothetical protein